MPSVAVRKVILQFPTPLLDRADHLADQLHTNRSAFIRTAVEEKLDRTERERLEEELRAGYSELSVFRRSAYAELEELVSDSLTGGD